jgi:ABC-type sugar transport system ATPase subunit
MTEEAAVFRHADFSLPIPEAQRPRLEADTRDRVLLGIRPEDLALATPPAGHHGVSISGTVEAVESLGSETYVTLNTGTSRCVWRSTARPAHGSGDQIELIAATDHLHWFDADNEETLGLTLSSHTREIRNSKCEIRNKP